MKELYDETSFACSKLITRRYSTSFSLGIQAFDKKFHQPVYGIYGFVRYADEIVDTFHDYDKEELIRRFRKDTFTAIAEGISLNPVLHAFQQVVHQYQIEHELIHAFLDSMETDLHKQRFSAEEYQRYIFGSAEAVGLMCLRVFCEGDGQLYAELSPYAKALGSAFQKINFLRDMRSDFEERQRVYFPEVDFASFGEAEKKAIEKEILAEFEYAREGIRRLPEGCRRGVFIAFEYYLDLYHKISRLPAETITGQRVRISDQRKIWLFARAWMKNGLNVI